MGVKRWNGSAYTDLNIAKVGNVAPTAAWTWVSGAYVKLWPEPVVISASGSLRSAASTGTYLSLTGCPAGIVGGMRVLTTRRSTTGRDISAVSGAGVTTWQKVHSQSAQGGVWSVWWGEITSTSGTEIVCTWDGSLGISTTICYSTQMFVSSRGAATNWTLDTFGFGSGASGATVTSPSLAPTMGGNELYISQSATSGSSSAGSTPGAVYQATASNDQWIYCTDVDAAYAPSHPKASGTWVTEAALFQAA